MYKVILLGFLMNMTTSFTSSQAITEAIPEPEPPPIHNVVMAEVSAYTSSIDETDETPDITASGERTRDGVAACPSRYKFGTKIEIGGKEYVCLDRMNARYRDGNYFDIWIEGKKEALEWGRRTLSVNITP